MVSHYTFAARAIDNLVTFIFTLVTYLIFKIFNVYIFFKMKRFSLHYFTDLVNPILKLFLSNLISPGTVKKNQPNKKMPKNGKQIYFL